MSYFIMTVVAAMIPSLQCTVLGEFANKSGKSRLLLMSQDDDAAKAEMFIAAVCAVGGFAAGSNVASNNLDRAEASQCIALHLSAVLIALEVSAKDYGGFEDIRMKHAIFGGFSAGYCAGYGAGKMAAAVGKRADAIQIRTPPLNTEQSGINRPASIMQNKQIQQI